MNGSLVLGIETSCDETSAAVVELDGDAFALRSLVILSQDVHAISRFIYGMNGWNGSGRPANLTLSRSGGNRMTAYNWETNASNAGSDYYNEPGVDGFAVPCPLARHELLLHGVSPDRIALTALA